MQRIPIVENVFCHTHKQFHLSHVTVADPDSSDSSRLYPNEHHYNSILAKFLLSVPKEVFNSIIIIIIIIILLIIIIIIVITEIECAGA